MRSGFFAALPTIVISVVAFLVDRDPTPALLAGSLLFVATWCFAWRGGDWRRSIVPGIAAGALPFVAMHIARTNGHVCNGALCFSVCLPVTFGAAAIAGLVIAHRARQSGAPLSAWIAAGIMAVLTGSLGCACIGIGGIAGLVVGVVFGSIPIALRATR